jgi:hypothetical protein
MRLETSIFLGVLGVTIAIWVLRGIGLFTFIPGGLIWILLFLTIGAGVVDTFQRTKRW